MNEEEDPFKRLEDDDVEEDPVQTLGADLSILKEGFADQIDPDISLDEYVDFDIEVSTLHNKLMTKKATVQRENQSSNQGAKKCKKLLEFSKISAFILSSERQ